ncbi:hypothetical protein HBN50_01305 [Halobacteriovorax sp. GB3]|uniref:hypothetical protein n=1 Tax=Halobacteriovorax sp. GB3 TaxID=2719615 RepID=UPI00235DFD63|nr:hypothetical protein [Halobacteriovorax sp. GB3]MDD0851705.1 hypothetical protein [Halobacteriovorax sp. GB3]
MKKLIFPLILVTSISAFADLKTVKVSDGTTASCSKFYDTVSMANRNGMYSAKAVHVSMTKDNVVRLSVALLFKRCEMVDEQAKVIPYSPLKTVNTKVFIGDPAGKDLTIETLQAKLKTYVDGKYEVINDLALIDKAYQVAQLSIPLEKLISDQADTELSEGKTVDASIDMFIRKEITRNDQADYSNLGKFRVHLKIESEKENLKVSLK